MSRLIELGAVVLMVINAVFLIGVSIEVARNWTLWTTPATLDVILGPDPGSHLPLAGMPGANYSDEDACLRLNGFLMDMNRVLTGRTEVPLSALEIHGLVEQGRCGMDDPTVRETVISFRRVYEEAGLPEIFNDEMFAP